MKLFGFALTVFLMLVSAMPLRAEHGNGSAPAVKYEVFTGQVTAVNAANGTITFRNKEATRSFTIGPDTHIKVNGQDAGLGAVQVGMYGGVKLQEGNPTPVMLQAQDPKQQKENIVYGQVTAVNADAGTVTFQSKEQTKSVAINSGTRVFVNDQEANLAAVQVGMYGGAKLDAAGKVLMIKVKSASAPKANK